MAYKFEPGVEQHFPNLTNCLLAGRQIINLNIIVEINILNSTSCKRLLLTSHLYLEKYITFTDTLDEGLVARMYTEGNMNDFSRTRTVYWPWLNESYTLCAFPDKTLLFIHSLNVKQTMHYLSTFYGA